MNDLITDSEFRKALKLVLNKLRVPAECLAGETTDDLVAVRDAILEIAGELGNLSDVYPGAATELWSIHERMEKVIALVQKPDDAAYQTSRYEYTVLSNLRNETAWLGDESLEEIGASTALANEFDENFRVFQTAIDGMVAVLEKAKPAIEKKDREKAASR